MLFDRILPVAALLAALFAYPLAAQEERAPDEKATAGIFNLIPGDKKTDHVLKTQTGDLPYTATAGTLDLFGQDGAVTAKIFYTAYTAKDRTPDRPLAFVFNGGPGAASAYLHLGVVGPRILEFGADGKGGVMPALSDNPDSWLAFTDLVLIDPVGTGWSRAVSNEAAGNFYGVQRDAESLAKAISLYVQHSGRMASPKYLVGESYGGFRAAKVAASLKDSQGILVSGVMMLSPLIEGRLLFDATDYPLGAALQLPSLAAAELERKKMFSPDAVARAEQFAMGDYMVTLAGAAPVGEAATTFYARVAALTGIPQLDVARTRGFVGDIYTKRSASTTGEVVSPYDAAVTAPDPYPESPYDHSDDPILDGYTRAYGAAFTAYARDELGFASEMTYSLLAEDVNRRWDWDSGRGKSRSDASSVGDLRDLLSVIPSFRLLVVHGYSDALTPYGVSRYIIDHLPPALADGRAELKVYRGGHMFYTRPDSRRELSADAREFFSDQKPTD